MNQKSKSVIKVTNYDELEKLKIEGPVLINITASWCGACRFFEPFLEKLANQYPSIKFLTIDLDEAEERMPDIIDHVYNIPHFDLYHDGVKVAEYCGSKADKLKLTIEQFKSKISNKNDPILENPSKIEFIIDQNTEKNKNSVDEIKYNANLDSEKYKAEKMILPVEPILDSKFVVNVSDAELFKQLISNNDSLVIIHDPSCPLSIFVYNLFNQMANQNPNIKFLKINVKEKMFIDLDHVCATPHFDLYKNGKKIKQYCGADELKLNEAINLLSSFSLKESNYEEKIDKTSKDLNTKEKYNEAIKYIDSSENFKQSTLNGASLVHYSADWCRPSLLIQPILENLAFKNPDIKFFKINLDKARLLMPNNISHITNIPFFELFFNGEKIGEFLGDNIIKLKKSINLLNAKINNN